MDWFYGNSPIQVVIAFWIAVATLILVVVMMVTIVVMRVRALRRERRCERVHAYWKAMFAHTRTATIPPMEPLSEADFPGFIDAWNEVHEELDGDTEPHLVAIAKRVGLRAGALHQLNAGFHDRATAIVALGHLRDQSVFERLQGYLNDKSPIISLCTARALSQLDAPRAMALFVPQVVTREDWVPGHVAQILKAGHRNTNAANDLSTALGGAHAEMTPRLVRFLVDMSPEAAAPVLRRALSTPDVDDHLVSTCLQLVTDREDIGLVRGFVEHPRWHVRMHAATALGRLGDESDTHRLCNLLSDQQWWVRYRAAQALATLPEVDLSWLARLADMELDKYASDILRQIIGEDLMRGASS